MTTLDAHWLIRSLGWTLLHFCWQGAVIALVLWCALQLLVRRSAQARYGATCIALGLMVVLPALTLTQIGLHEYRLTLEIKHSVTPAESALAVEAGLAAGSWLRNAASALDPLLPGCLRPGSPVCLCL